MGQKPNALVHGLACEYKHELLLPVRALTLQSSQGPVLLPSSSSEAALTSVQESRRGDHAFSCHLHVQGGYLGNSPQVRTARAVVSTLCNHSKTSLLPPDSEKGERNVAVSRRQLSEDKIQWYICSLYSDKGGNTTLPPKLYNVNISSFPYLKAPLISNYF